MGEGVPVVEQEARGYALSGAGGEKIPVSRRSCTLLCVSARFNSVLGQWPEFGEIDIVEQVDTAFCRVLPLPR